LDFSSNEIAAGLGLLHNLRLSDRLDLIVDMRATAVSGRVHQDNGVAIIPSVTMGLAVDLGWPGFVRTSTIVTAVEVANAEKEAILEAAALALEAANLSLAEENEELAEANDDLTKQLANLKKTEVDYSTFFEKMEPAIVYFEIGQAVLDDKEMQHLDFIAKNLIASADKNTKIYLTLLGTADDNTGTLRRNQHLSEARAKYIYDLLTTKYDISKERLIIKSEVVKNSPKPELSRAVSVSF
jgi:outer membrane protein OmpA-like peptidoglycan-associated protein